MKKLIQKSVLFAVVALGLVACNKSNPSANFNPALYGEWELTEKSNYGDEIELDEQKLMVLSNEDATTDFRKIVFFTDGSEMRCVYQEDADNSLRIGETTLMISPERKTYTLEDENTLVLRNLGYTERFKRVN